MFCVNVANSSRNWERANRIKFLHCNWMKKIYRWLAAGYDHDWDSYIPFFQKNRCRTLQIVIKRFWIKKLLGSRSAGNPLATWELETCLWLSKSARHTKGAGSTWSPALSLQVWESLNFNLNNLKPKTQNSKSAFEFWNLSQSFDETVRRMAVLILLEIRI